MEEGKDKKISKKSQKREVILAKDLSSDKKEPRGFVLKSHEKRFLAIVILVSLIFGAVGSVFGSQILKELQGVANLGVENKITQNLSVNETSAVIDAVNKVSPSVVSITSEQSKLDFFGDMKKSRSSGTGFIISSDGLIITNKHVVGEEDSEYSVFTSDGKEYKAKIQSRDSLNDIAFIKVDAKDLRPVEIGNSDALKVGQQVIAIGNALGQYQNTVTTGVVSAKGRAVPVGGDNSTGVDTLENVIQTDAAINPGNSGGPLINLAGQVVGINTAIDSSGQGIGFAIPIDMVKKAIKSVETSGKVVRPYIGIRYVPITKEFASRNNLSESTGVLVYGGKDNLAIIPNGPADKAGIKEGDIVTEINGNGINKDRTLISLIQNYSVGETVSITLIRDGQKKVIAVRLAESK